MAIRLPHIASSKKVPKGYFAVYVGENQKRFVIPVSFLNQPLFQDFLGMSEEEFGYSHPTGVYTSIEKNNAIPLPRIVSSKKIPKGYFAVYVGENQKRFVIPVGFLNKPSFQDFLRMSEEEFGYTHPTGGLRIPGNKDIFLDVTSRLN
ncbi:auxin-induced protein 15A-like [Hibiscus syriacus]|uniref:auxin-induced protein 15A-like n=1 Tax=Hibiscus syriacus TaxID=106335 RepID=UPI0019227744|nr:auxin-induced protein 15A-like [Hibiscus syriacus]